MSHLNNKKFWLPVIALHDFSPNFFLKSYHGYKDILISLLLNILNNIVLTLLLHNSEQSVCDMIFLREGLSEWKWTVIYKGNKSAILLNLDLKILVSVEDRQTRKLLLVHTNTHINSSIHFISYWVSAVNEVLHWNPWGIR